MLYQTGKSKYANGNTTLRRLIRVYTGYKKNYSKDIARDLQVNELIAIKRINTDSLVKYLIKYEQGYYFKKLYQ